MKKVPKERKFIYAIYFIVASYSWWLLFSYCSHLNSTTLNGNFWRRNVSVNGNREILKCMFALNGTSLGTKIIIILIFIVYCYFIFESIPVNLLKNAPINIAIVIFTNILEMHCLNCDGTKWRTCMNI